MLVVVKQQGTTLFFAHSDIDGVRCQWQAVLVNVSRQGSEKGSQLASLCRIDGHALTHNIRWELRWKKGQESNTEMTDESDTQDCEGPAIQENKTKYQSRKQEVNWKMQWKNSTSLEKPPPVTVYMHAYREWNIYTITHISYFASQDCTVFDIYTRTPDCLHEVELRGCHSHASITDKNKKTLLTHNNPVAALTPPCWLYGSMDVKQCMSVCYCPAGDLHFSFAVISLTCSFPFFSNVLAAVQNSALTIPRGIATSGPWKKMSRIWIESSVSFSGSVRDVVYMFGSAIYIIF